MYTPELDREAEALARCYALARERARQLRQQATLNKTVVAGNLGGTATTTAGEQTTGRQSTYVKA